MAHLSASERGLVESQWIAVSPTGPNSMYRAGQVAKMLAISPSTLRLWTVEFASELSEFAIRRTTADGAPAQRRFTEIDLQVLREAGTCLRNGLTYRETLDHLRANRHHRQIERRIVDPDALQAQIAVLREALRAKDDALAEARRLTGALEDQIGESRQSARAEHQAYDQALTALRRELVTERDLGATLRIQASDLRSHVRLLEAELAQARSDAGEAYPSSDSPWWKRRRRAS